MSNIFKGPTLPTPQVPARMPDPEDPAVLEAKRRAASEALARGGRASTILTTPGGRGGSVGFDSFSGTKTGA